MKKRYLVTGAAGFIGAGVVQNLMTRSESIIALDCVGADWWRLAMHADKAVLLEADITNVAQMQEIIVRYKPTHYYHFAAYGMNGSQADVDTIYRVNFEATRRLIDMFTEHGGQFFLNCGSSSEYGRRDIPLSEDLVLHPCTDYAVSKAAATNYAMRSALATGKYIYTVRPFSVYGPQEMAGRFMTDLIKAAVLQQRVHLSTPGSVRDFIFRDDFIAVCSAVENILPRGHYVFNAGSGRQRTLKEVVTQLTDLVDGQLEVVWGKKEPRPWEPTMWRSDQTLTTQVLSVTPSTPLREGLSKMLEWGKTMEVTWRACDL